MTESQNRSVKILFRYYSAYLEEWAVETMWAETVDAGKGLYRLDSIPFYGPPVASNDLVFAEYDADEKSLTYRETIQPSGNSIVAVVIMDKGVDVNSVRDVFAELGCSSERLNDRYFSMEVPANNKYLYVKDKLEELQRTG